LAIFNVLQRSARDVGMLPEITSKMESFVESNKEKLTEVYVQRLHGMDHVLKILLFSSNSQHQCPLSNKQQHCQCIKIRMTSRHSED
jgi:hypothetical protein